MAIKQQEKNFLIGIAIFGVLVGLLIVVFPLISSGEKSAKKEPPPNKESVRVELAPKPIAKPPELKPPKPNAKPEPQPAQARPQKTEREPPAPAEATMVLSQPEGVPADYFQDGSGVTAIPRVIERYLEAVDNGSRFMGRLEAIALRENDILAEQRAGAKSGQPLQLDYAANTKVISYNMKIKTPFLSARFDAEAVDGFKGDVLVEWVDEGSNQRIELFFTPVTRDGAEALFRLNMPEDSAPPASQVFVYAATDDMPLIASGSYQP